MRLEGQTKMGYYPTPGATLSLIPSWLSVPDTGRLRRYLDPCCGKGEALAHIANGDADTYGIELSDVRAKEAEDALGRVLNCAYEYVQLADETFSLILLNPPYDGETITGGGKRMEETFLVDRGTTDLLVLGGILIYIIPHSRINETTARHLAGWYTDLRCFKLPTEEYDVFKQVVIFAFRRDSYSTPKGETFSDVMAWKNGQRFAGYEETQVEVEENGEKKTKKARKPVFVELDELAAGNGEYVVPFSPEKGKRGASFRWQYIAVSDEHFRREAEDAAARMDASRDWVDLTPATEPPTIEPAMTPKKGHIAMQMSGGLLGTNLVRNPETQQSLLIKGGVSKYTVTKHGDVVADVVAPDGDDDKDRLTKVETEERFSTQLSTLSADGELVIHTEPAEIGGLLEKYVEQLAEIVQSRNRPQYDMKPDTWEWEILDPLSKGRTLPGRNETGLTEFQKHLTVALGRLCLTHGAGFVNAEMGSTRPRSAVRRVITFG